MSRSVHDEIAPGSRWSDRRHAWSFASEALEFLPGADRIVHAGDVGDRKILEELMCLAPLCVVRGNNDRQAWARRLQDEESIDLRGMRILVVHNLDECDLPRAAKTHQIVVSGHSHRPRAELRDGVLLINPGSAGPRRFKLPIAAGELRVEAGHVDVRIVDLESGRTLVEKRRAGLSRADARLVTH